MRMSVERNNDSFRRYVEEVWKEEKLDIVDEVFGAKYLSRQPDGSVLERGPEDVKKYHSSFLDIEDSVEDMIGEDDKVVPRCPLCATNTGDFRGIPTSGNQVHVTGIGIFRFSKDGKIVESWDSLDQFGMMRQLDAIPEPREIGA